MPQSTAPDLIVGTDTGDDAAVWRRPDGRALVSTADFFTPIVDDARTWGRIAATNAGSDVYAMGGRPLFALNLVAWPRDELDLEVLGDVLAGGAEAAEAGGWIVAGGHTVDGPEPFYGQAVTGEVDADAVVTNAGGQPGQVLVLTKPLGTGIVTTAVKRSPGEHVDAGGPLHDIYMSAVAEMCRHNDDAAVAMAATDVGAGTDVTGFGMLGHLHKLAAASGCRAIIDSSSVPLLDGVGELVSAGFVPGGTIRNLDFVDSDLDRGDLDGGLVSVLADAQTSGGLLFSCSAPAAADAVDRLGQSGHAAAVIGELGAGSPGSILLR